MPYVDVAGLATWQLLAAGDAAMGFLRAGYDAVSPDGPEHFPVIYAKTLQMVRTEPEIDLETLHTVGAPTLVLQADRDEVTVEHSIDVVKSLPDARFSVLPGTHARPVESPEVVNPLLVAFLAGGPPVTEWTTPEP